MATAEEYAAWIVANPARRGTPEFQTVVQAYEQAKAQQASVPELSRPVAPAAPAPSPSIGQRIVGAGEAALSLATGATGGAIGTLAGTGRGLAQEILSGNFGTQQSLQRVSQAAQRGATALTYQPRTQVGQEMAQAAGQALSETLPVIPAIGAPGALVSGVRQAAPVARAATMAAEPVVQAVAQAPARAARAVQRAAGFGEQAAATPEARVSGASIGASATPEATRRQVIAEQFGVRPTLGQATRDEEQLAFEVSTLTKPEGQPLRDRARENNIALLTSAERMIDETGARFVEKADVGDALTSALLRGADNDRVRVRSLYTEARKSPESRAIVDPNVLVTIGQGDLELNTSPIGFLNDQVTGVPSSAVTDSARKIALKMGIAREDSSGNLIGVPSTVAQMEDFRKELVGLADRTDARAIRQETILKKLVDAQTEPVSGPLFRQARAARESMARKFENRAVIANLISRRGGSEDMRVSADRAFDVAVLNAPRGEVRFLKQVLSTLGEDGKRAIEEIQGATVRHILSAATSGNRRDANDQPVISSAQLNRVIRGLDANDRLDIIMGKQGAQRLRDLNEVAQYISTLPPNTRVNTSGTTNTIMQEMTKLVAETGAQSMVSGFPVPVWTIAQQIRKARIAKKNRQELEAKIQEALNALPTTLERRQP